jgi:hypothetical protein
MANAALPNNDMCLPKTFRQNMNVIPTLNVIRQWRLAPALHAGMDAGVSALSEPDSKPWAAWPMPPYVQRVFLKA